MKTWLNKNVSKYLGEKNIDVNNTLFTFKKFIKNLANIEDEINMIIDINPKERPHITISISNEIMKPMLVFYVHHDVIFKLTEKY